MRGQTNPALTSALAIMVIAAATLAGVERLGPQRLTLLAAREGVTQPAMTQLISRLEESGLVRREASQEDGRVVLVVITDEGRAVLAQRRLVRTGKLAGWTKGKRALHDFMADTLVIKVR